MFCSGGLHENFYTLKINEKLFIDVVRKDIKNIHLAVYPPNGRVRIAVPLRIDDESVRLFAISKIAWIGKHQRKFENQAQQSSREYLEKESYYFEGRRYLLRITEHNAPAKVEIKTKTHLDLFVRPNTSTEQRQAILTEWYRQQLKAQLPALIAKWEKIIGVTVNDWGVKQMKTKWGTCNINAGRIWLNLELIKKPEHCLEYVVVHEMVHLLERHHNDNFTAYMDQFLPQWRSCCAELNQLILNHAEWS